MRNSFLLVLTMMMLAFGFASQALSAATDSRMQGLSGTSVQIEHSSEVMDEFNEERELAAERAISTNRKHQILFWMGGLLLLLIFLAAGFGIAMGIFGKDVFVWHMLSAGLATTLAIAHAITAFVWFYPG